MRIPGNPNEEVYVKQYKAARYAFLCELSNLVVVLIDGFLANTLLVWMDAYSCFEATVHDGIVWFIAAKMKKENGDNYNFGMERLEAITSFLCDMLILSGDLVLIITAILGFMNPQKPNDVLGLFVLLKACNISWDIWFCWLQGRISKMHESRLTDTELQVYLEYLARDVAVGLAGCVVYFFRNNPLSWYLSPAVTLLIALYCLVRCLKRLKGSFSDLSDLSIPVKDQDAIFDTIIECCEPVKRVKAVNCRMLNHKMYVEFVLVFKDDVTFEQQKKLLAEITKKVKEQYENSHTRFVIEQDED